jgi:nitrous oxidase accessory protein
LASGQYNGNFVVPHTLTLTTASNKSGDRVVIDAQGKGNALLLNHANITIEKLFITHWDNDLIAQNAGIYAAKDANHMTK